MAGAAAREDRAHAIAAVCLVLSSVCTFVCRIAHGDLPTDTGAEALAFVAAHPLYPVVHLGDWLGVLVWTGGLVALAGSLRHPTAWALGRLGAASALVGAAVHITEFSVDGYALPTLAGQWATAPAADRAALEAGARLALVVIGGPSTSALVVLWGTALALYALALAQEGYPAPLAWSGVAIAALVFALGVVQFVRPNLLFPGVLLYGGGTIATQPWTLALGLAAWRRGAAATSSGCAAGRTGRPPPRASPSGARPRTTPTPATA